MSLRKVRPHKLYRRSSQEVEIMIFLRTALVAVLFSLASVVTLQAQSTAEVNGTVADPNGAAVAGAAVKLVNQATKIEAEATSNQSGYFAFINLKPASYVLFVEARGFKRAQTPAFTVGVTEAITQNVTLVIGEVSEVVEVVAGAEIVQRTSTGFRKFVAKRVQGTVCL
jgi:Carboxypeptidase regulatory-like domain